MGKCYFCICLPCLPQKGEKVGKEHLMLLVGLTCPNKIENALL